MPAGAASPAIALREQLQSVLEDIQALSIQLKGTGRTAAAASEALPAGARSVLAILKRHGPLTVPSIAGMRSTSRQNIQGIVNRLSAEGWVHLVPNPSHKKSELVSLTEPGAARLRKADGAYEQSLELMLAEISEAELVSASNFLQHLRQILQQRLEGTAPTASKSGRGQHRKNGDRQKHSKAEIPTTEDEMPVNLL